MTACVLSLFAGYGGLDIALEDVLNVTPVYVADIEPGPSKVLAFRYPHAPNLGDVTKVTWSSLTGVRVICGGSPCQDISTAGKQAGMKEGTRSNLWVEMRDAIATLRPELVLWENVHAARSADAASELEPCPGCVGGADDAEPVLRALGRVLGDLAELGFDAEWVSLPAAGVGCAHLRWRVFVVAWPADAPSNPGWIGHGDGRAAADAARVGHERSRGTRDGWDRSQDRNLNPLTLVPTPSVADSMGGHERRGGKRGDELLLKGLVKSIEWGDYADSIARAEAVFGPAPEPTETDTCACGSKVKSRRLSCAFDEWLIGLPAGWITDVPGVTHQEALKLCGNGVVPAQAALALRICLARRDEATA